MLDNIKRKITFKLTTIIKQLQSPNHKEIFSSIYKNQVWGNVPNSPFYSGGGSDEEYAKPYVEAIVRYIRENKIKSVVDLGCGDFRIGKEICEKTRVNYMGIDVVPELVEYNKKNFASDDVDFDQLNIVYDPLPKGELYLIRQVFQHLSNQDIRRVLKKLSSTQHLIITEHQPAGSYIANLDKVPGSGIRLEVNSGVFLDKSPFNKKIKKLTEMPSDRNSIIATYIVYNYNTKN